MSNSINHHFMMPYGGQGMSSPGLWNMPDQSYQYNGGTAQQYNPQGWMGGFTGGGSNAGMVNALRTYGQYQQMPGAGGGGGGAQPPQGQAGAAGQGMGSAGPSAAEIAQRQQQFQQMQQASQQQPPQPGAQPPAPPPSRAPAAGESSWGDVYSRMYANNPSLGGARGQAAGLGTSGTAPSTSGGYPVMESQKSSLGGASGSAAGLGSFELGQGAMQAAPDTSGHRGKGLGTNALARAARQKAGRGMYEQAAASGWGPGVQVTDPNALRLLQATGSGG